MIYIFDVDGTLTPSRGRMNTEFALFFEDFVNTFECYLITGSDREKTLDFPPCGFGIPELSSNSNENMSL